MFMKKKPIETPEYKAQQAEATKQVAATEQVNVGKNPFVRKPVEPVQPIQPSTEEVIATETDLWYKAQVLELLAEIVQRLRKYD